MADTQRPADSGPERKLNNVLKQLSGLLERRKVLIELRKGAWLALPWREEPLEQAQFEQVSQREGQRGLQQFCTELFNFGKALLAQQPSPTPSGSQRLQLLGTEHEEMSLRELELQVAEETRERHWPPDVLEAARAQPPTPGQERILKLTQKVRELTQRARELADEVQQFREQMSPSHHVPPLQMPAPSAAPPAHAEKGQTSAPEPA